MTTLAVPNPIQTDAPLRLWTRGEFARMLDTDIFPSSEDVYLRDGQVFRVGDVRSRLWTRDEYYRLAEAGILDWEERVELLEGEIIEKMTIHPPHAVAVGKTADLLRGVFSPGFIIREQTASSASDYSDPEPDVLVAPGTHDDYRGQPPKPSEAALVVEVSDTTLHKDRTKKARIYALAGCREYWIVNLQKRTLEVSRSPVGDAFQDKQTYAETDTLTPLTAPGVSVRAADLLPRLALLPPEATH